MRILFCVLMVLLIITGCKKTEHCEPETYSYIFKSNAKVDTATRESTGKLYAFPGSGDKLVFNYVHAHSPCDKNIVDGFVSSNLYFEVNPSLTHFVFTGDDMQDVKCYYTYFTDGYSLAGSYHPAGGTIEGDKISAMVWSLRFNLQLRNGESLIGSGKFTMD
jgi:hypothetical protein